MRKLLPLLLISATGLFAQLPLVYYRGVLNVASSMAPGLPGGAIARGAMFTFYGRNMGPANSPPLSFPLGNNLGGVVITITQGNVVMNAIPVFVSPGQIQAIMPSDAPLGMVSMKLTYNNAPSNPVPVQVVTSAFGVFSALQTGIGPGAAYNYISAGNQPRNAMNVVAQPGQTITLYGVGLGAISGPDNMPPLVVDLPTQTEVFVAGHSAAVTYHGRLIMRLELIMS